MQGNMIYSLDRVEAMSEGDEDFVMSIITLFLEEIPSDMVVLGEAIESKNYEQTYQTAHKMKPNLEIMGMDDSRTLAYEIETLGKQEGDFSSIEEKYKVLGTHIEQAVEELRRDFSL